MTLVLEERGAVSGREETIPNVFFLLDSKLQFNPSVDESTSIHATPRGGEHFSFFFSRHGNIILPVAIIIREGEDTHENIYASEAYPFSFLFFESSPAIRFSSADPRSG